MAKAYPAYYIRDVRPYNDNSAEEFITAEAFLLAFQTANERLLRDIKAEQVEKYFVAVFRQLLASRGPASIMPIAGFDAAVRDAAISRGHLNGFQAGAEMAESLRPRKTNHATSRSGPTVHAAGAELICRRFNRAEGCSSQFCIPRGYRHICSVCKSTNHGAVHCPSRNPDPNPEPKALTNKPPQ